MPDDLVMVGLILLWAAIFAAMVWFYRRLEQ